MFPSRAHITLKTQDYRLEISAYGRGMLFNPRTGEILSLNQTGAFIVQTLSTSHMVSDLVHRFTERYDLGLAAAHEDVSEFLYGLHEMGLLEVDATS